MTEVFLKILNMGITSGWIVLAVLLLRFFLKKAPKWILCLLWGVVALRLILPVSLESAFSLLPSAEVIPGDVVSSHSPAIQSSIPAVNALINPVLSEHIKPGANNMGQILDIASMVWIAGVAVLLAYSALSYFRLRWQVRASVLYAGNIYICDDVQSPFILGVFRPRIYLPSGMDQEQISYVLAHENAHIKRKDHWWKPLGFLLLSVYWFNPLLWVAYILLCRDIERACDEKVVSRMDDLGRKGYSHALIACSVHRRTVMSCPVAFGEVSVKARIKGVLNYKKPAFWIVLVSAVACVIMAIGFLTNPKPCVHEYHGQITANATCTREGVETFTCRLCKHSYTSPVAVLAHSYNEGVVVTEPSCVQLGSRELSCIGCGAVKREEIKKTDHTAGEPFFVTEPNCTEKGGRSATCGVCQTVFLLEVLETNDVHDMKETVVRAATCGAAGEGVNACTRCSYSETCTYEQLEHSYKDGITFLGTCATAGSQQQICTGCGAERWLTLPKSTEHRWMYMGFYWPEQCSVCGATKSDSSYSTRDSSWIDELYQPPKTKTPEDVLPVIRIWP